MVALPALGVEPLIQHLRPADHSNLMVIGVCGVETPCRKAIIRRFKARRGWTWMTA
jgi:hypothetical protein